MRRLRDEGVIAASASVVVLATAAGLKDPAVTERRLGAVPVVTPSMGSVWDALKTTYGFTPD